MRATGTAVAPSASWMSCSRTMSCAVGSTPVAGGPPSTQSWAPLRTRKVRLDEPPASCSISTAASSVSPRSASQRPRRAGGATRSTSAITAIVYGGNYQGGSGGDGQQSAWMISPEAGVRRSPISPTAAWPRGRWAVRSVSPAIAVPGSSMPAPGSMRCSIRGRSPRSARSSARCPPTASSPVPAASTGDPSWSARRTSPPSPAPSAAGATPSAIASPSWRCATASR